MSLRTDHSITVYTKFCYKFIPNEHEFDLLLSCFAHLRFHSYADEFFSRVFTSATAQEDDRSRFLEPRVAEKRLETPFLERDKSRFNKATRSRIENSTKASRSFRPRPAFPSSTIRFSTPLSHPLHLNLNSVLSANTSSSPLDAFDSSHFEFLAVCLYFQSSPLIR